MHPKQPSVQFLQQDAIRRYIAQKRMILVRKANNALKNPLTVIHVTPKLMYRAMSALNRLKLVYGYQIKSINA